MCQIKLSKVNYLQKHSWLSRSSVSNKNGLPKRTIVEQQQGQEDGHPLLLYPPVPHGELPQRMSKQTLKHERDIIQLDAHTTRLLLVCSQPLPTANVAVKQLEVESHHIGAKG